jgi:hypothetical protein
MQEDTASVCLSVPVPEMFNFMHAFFINSYESYDISHEYICNSDAPLLNKMQAAIHLLYFFFTFLLTGCFRNLR